MAVQRAMHGGRLPARAAESWDGKQQWLAYGEGSDK